MSNRENKKRVNFFDGQRVTERDLDNDQSYFRELSSGLLIDKGEFGVIDKLTDEDYLILDINNVLTSNPTYDVVNNGKFDGKIIRPDYQPKDSVYGDRIQIDVSKSNSRGRYSTKILIVGKVFNDLEEKDSLVYEIIDVKTNGKFVSQNYYNHIYAFVLANYSGGSLFTENDSEYESRVNSTDDTSLIFSSARPLSVFDSVKTVFQDSSPSFDAYNFPNFYPSFSEMLDEAVGPQRSSQEFFTDFSFRKEEFSPSNNVGDGTGIKFLSDVDNVQSFSVLMSIENSGSWSGDMVFSIFELQTTSSSRVAADPIGFDPSQKPIAQVALDQQDLEDRGIFLSQEPQEIIIDFSRFDCANPDSGLISKNKYYCLFIERVGDNRVNTINLFKGDFLPYGKTSASIPLNPEETFSKQTYKMFKYDSSTERYVDYSNESLWFRVNSSCIEVIPGSAYSHDGFYLNIPKSKEYVGSTRILNFKNKISIPSFGEKQYVVLKRKEVFSELNVHPRTGNYIHTRISDDVMIDFISPPIDINNNLILASVNDKNTREKISISGSFPHAGLYEGDHFFIVRPTSQEKSVNYRGMNFIPDTGCQCNNEYQIIDFELFKLKAGDLNRDGKYSIEDSTLISDLSGNTINSEATERRFFGGEISIEDFYLADLNNDGAIDGFDILKSENASNGNIDFESGIEIEFLKIYVENLRKSGRPSIFSGSANTIPGTNTISFTSPDAKIPLIIRIGDKVSIVSTESYTDVIVKSKIVDADGVSVTIGVETESGQDPVFSGASAQINIFSFDNTNILADNTDLVSTPYSQKNYSIFVDETEFRRFNIEICDLRNFISFTKRIEYSNECRCEGEHVCEKAPVQELNIDGDVKVSGTIKGSGGLPYRSDFEFASIKIPLPAGSIDGCSLNIYDSFVKSNDNSCFTSSGLPALRFSDGTYVGCNDTEGSNDIDKNRVKFLYGIASLFVDTDAAVSETETPTITDTESFDAYSEERYNDYRPNVQNFTFSVSSSNASYSKVGTSSGRIDLSLTTGVSDEFSKAVMPSSDDRISGDFILDFSIDQLSGWGSTSSGFVESFSRVLITNTDGSSGIFDLGIVEMPDGLKLFSRTITYDASSAELFNETFIKEFENPNDQKIFFRIRRTYDSIKGYFYIDDDRTQPSVLGLYERVDSNPKRQIGYGDGEFSINKKSISATQGESFSSRFRHFYIKSNYISLPKSSDLTISKNSSNEMVRTIGTVNVPISSRVSLDSAKLNITSRRSYGSSYVFRGAIRFFKLANAYNLDTLNNYFDPLNSSRTTSFEVLGPLSPGDTVQITGLERMLQDMQDLRNFVSGTTRAFSLESTFVNSPPSNYSESFEFSATLSMIFTYQDLNQGITYKVGVDLDTETGIMTFNTKNVLYDDQIKENRTVLNVGVLLKKSGFLNSDSEIGIDTIREIGIGNCVSVEDIDAETIATYCAAVAEKSTAGVVVGSYECGSYLADPDRSSPAPSPYEAVPIANPNLP